VPLNKSSTALHCVTTMSSVTSGSSSEAMADVSLRTAQLSVRRKQASYRQVIFCYFSHCGLDNIIIEA